MNVCECSRKFDWDDYVWKIYPEISGVKKTHQCECGMFYIMLMPGKRYLEELEKSILDETETL